MPLVKFPSGAEGLIEFYQPYDKSKPTIALLPPSLGYASMYEAYIQDPDLKDQYNIVGVQSSVSNGPTKAVANPGYDLFVAAAEVAYMLNAHHIPPVHLFAPESHGPHIAFCLAAAFPERLASICVSGGTSLNQDRNAAFWEAGPAHLNPWDPEGWIEVVSAIASLLYGARHFAIPSDTLDLLVEADAKKVLQQPEALYMHWKPLLDRNTVPENLLPQLACNVLFFQHRPDAYTEGPAIADECLKHLPAGKAEIVHMKDATPGMGLALSQEVLPLWKSFLKHQPQKLEFEASDTSEALQRLRSLFESQGVDFQGRDPSDPSSFSMYTPAEVAESQERLNRVKARYNAYKGTPCPLPFGQGPDPWSPDCLNKLEMRFSRRHELEALASRPKKFFAPGCKVEKVIERVVEI